MIYYATPSSEAARDLMSAGRLGCITTPHQRNTVFSDEWDMIADNGCFSGRWTFEHWQRWLLDQPRRFRFAVCPDVFHRDGAPCHDETLERWHAWSGMIERAGHTPAFVCQVGATPDNVPDAPVLFLGGTTDWKLSDTAAAITAAGKARGAWVHMGRVNSQRRLKLARLMDCDSADGTWLAFGPDRNLPVLMSYLDEAQSIPMLWET